MYSQNYLGRENQDSHSNSDAHLYQMISPKGNLPNTGMTGQKLNVEILKHNRPFSSTSGLFDPSFLRIWVQSVEHRLRTSTSVILGYAGLMDSKPLQEGGSLQQTATQAILTNANEISDIIDKVSIYAALLTGNYVWIDFDLTEIASGISAVARSRLENIGLHYQPELTTKSIFVCGDPVLIQNAIIGMIDFAATNSPRAGAVILSLHSSAEFAYVRVVSQWFPGQDQTTAFQKTLSCDPTTGIGGDLDLPVYPILAKTIIESFSGCYSIEQNRAAITVQQMLFPLSD